ncbi:MAG TPA: DUF4928 family protein [Sphingomonas sp.]|nr:DUF4928 family protein [Sphingomonas sp.]
MSGLLDELAALARDEQMLGKGFLGIALVVTDKAVREGLPLDPNSMLTAGGAQVQGASGARVQAILKTHGIGRRLTSEGGRTSRGGPRKMQAYVAFLNHHWREEPFDLAQVMAFWIDRVRDYFASRPFVLDLDAASGMRGTIRKLVAAVEHRQKELNGATLVGTVVQHLIGAKLEIALGLEAGALARHGASVSDQGGRSGDLEQGDTVIHVTTAPGSPLIEKCAANLAAGKRPLIVTGRNRLASADGLLDDAGLSDRVDVLDYEGFLAANVFELGRFERDGRQDAIKRIVERYNIIIDMLEGDPSLRIELR